MNRFAVPTLVVSFVAAGSLAGWAIWERSEKNRLSDEVAALKVQLATSIGGGDAGSAAAPGSKGGKGPRPEVAAKATAGGAAVKPEEGAGKSMADGLVQMMKDPKTRDVMKASARMQVDMMNRDLYDLLDLQEPKRSQLEKLIGEKAAAAMEIGFSMLGEKKTPEEMKAISAELAKKTKEMDDKIKELVGEDDFNKVKRFEDSANERMQLKTFTGMLASKNLEMDEATETRLMDVMYEERKNFPFATNFGSQQNADMSRFTPENIARFGDEYGQMSQAVVQKAGGVLNAQQLEVFRQSQDQMGSMMKMHIDMAGKMFGTTGGEQPANP